MAKNVERLPERLNQLLAGDAKKDKTARFHWRLLSTLWNYAADCLAEIADDAASVDRAMRAGFNWEMGPFELWDAAGVRATVERMKAAAEPVSAQVERLLASGALTWYRKNACFEPVRCEYVPVVQPEGVARVTDFRASHGVVRQNAGASLLDLGDGVACVELHSKKNTVGEDIVRLLTDSLRPDGDAVRNFDAFVISGDVDHFSVGANIMQLLLSAQEEEWDEIDLAIRAFQRMTAAIKFYPRPVVAAPFGMCLGGGAEMALHSAHRQAHAELYMGLVETGVGLLPGGGGCKEMTIRAEDGGDPPGTLRKYFETIAMAKLRYRLQRRRRAGSASYRMVTVSP
jgi:3-hydroxyacyl-CoA dehydrogenase